MLNKITLIGNIGKTPEIRNTSDGREIANFSLATSESWKDKNTGERKQTTDWHNIVIFSQGLVGLVKDYAKKGSRVYIEGKLKTRKYTDRSGVDRYITEIILNDFGAKMLLLDNKQNANWEDPQRPEKQDISQEEELSDFEDTAPF